MLEKNMKTMRLELLLRLANHGAQTWKVEKHIFLFSSGLAWISSCTTTTCYVKTLHGP